MYTVIGMPQTRAMRVIWMLEELEQPYDIVPAPPRSEEIKAVNGTGKVPAMKVGDDILTDSFAIVTFLADRHGAFTAPAGSVDRAIQDSHLHFIAEEMDAPLWTASKNSFIYPEGMRVKEIKPVVKFEYDQAVARLSKRLGSSDYLMGDTFSVPDIFAVHCLNWGRAAKFDVTDETVLAYSKRCRARPAFRRAAATAS
ncbi:MAG: glutathione S-transferase family protein [Pseudomonadota bacterium]